MIFKYLISIILINILPILYIIKFLRKFFYPQDNILLGVQPLISNKYWSSVLNRIGLKSKSVVIGTFLSIKLMILIMLLTQDLNFSNGYLNIYCFMIY